MGTALRWIVGAGLVAVAVFAIVEATLLKASRYRLTHGDGRERTFRSKG